MAKERSFRVFVIYALIFQFMIIAAMNNSIEKSNLTVIQDYTPRESVVQIMVSYSDHSDPEAFLPSYTGTGTAIATKGDTVYVLTARHVCLPYSPLLAYLSGLEQETEIQNSTGEYHTADIVLISDYEDICIVSYETPDASATSLGLTSIFNKLFFKYSDFLTPLAFALSFIKFLPPKFVLTLSGLTPFALILSFAYSNVYCLIINKVAALAIP